MLNLIPHFSPVLDRLWQDAPEAASVPESPVPTVQLSIGGMDSRDYDSAVQGKTAEDIDVKLPFLTGEWIAHVNPNLSEEEKARNTTATDMKLSDFVKLSPTEAAYHLENAQFLQWNGKEMALQPLPQPVKDKILAFHTALRSAVPYDYKDTDGNIDGTVGTWQVPVHSDYATLDLSLEKMTNDAILAPTPMDPKDNVNAYMDNFDCVIQEDREVKDENGKPRTDTNGDKQYYATGGEAYLWAVENRNRAKQQKDELAASWFENLIKFLESLFGYETLKAWDSSGHMLSDEARDACASGHAVFTHLPEGTSDNTVKELTNRVNDTAIKKQQHDKNKDAGQAKAIPIPFDIIIPENKDYMGYPPLSGQVFHINSVADLNRQDGYGRTPLHWVSLYATAGGKEEIKFIGQNKDEVMTADQAVSVLLGHGAQATIEDNMGKTPTKLALRAFDSEVYGPYYSKNYRRRHGLGPDPRDLDPTIRRLRAATTYQGQAAYRDKLTNPKNPDYEKYNSTSVQYGDALRPRWVSIPNDQLEANAYRSGNKWYLKNDSPWQDKVEKEPVYMSPDKQEWLREIAINKAVAEGTIENKDVEEVRKRQQGISTTTAGYGAAVNAIPQGVAADNQLLDNFMELGIKVERLENCNDEQLTALREVLKLYQTGIEELEKHPEDLYAPTKRKDYKNALEINYKIAMGESVPPPDIPKDLSQEENSRFYLPEWKKKVNEQAKKG